MTLRIGISGWRYAAWRGRFYPPGLPQREELAYAARRFPSVELNGSFHALQRPSSYRRWHDATPRGFVFAVKGPRFVTHVKRLRDVEAPLANFFASGVLALRGKLGPLLWQFPPGLAYEPERLEGFLARLPRDFAAARALARRHDRHVAEADLAAPRNRRLRHAVEVRHGSYACADFVAQLRRHRVALAVADSAGRWPRLEDVTAGFMYLRLHGDTELYASGYGNAALDGWARRIRAWARGGQPRGACTASRAPPPKRKSRDVYCYFDNDARGAAPFDALRLAERLARR
ncbi:DUF72 domain-containing protein [Fulvimonas soli]|jgi:uncharacterized protein YecE (DUF72 family)|uniref:Uncharacterized protein YecE (DUF72 family) n=1 Tax=Fulvimonas soli TaxID=155197 RepID=A0A316I2H0_9GAMM|nr:DUF72 domain-containing protein [Fulvimonas soli]PWK86704.1 uncharacterized protein YecE (DUF72 family) [Fulvimonas soli]TNY25758.1 hypothetical protein BV497_12200 [Fulvimonas soli]